MKHKKKVFLVTGAAGFIGFHICNRLIKKRFKVIGIDGMTNYYDVNLKKERLKILKKNENFFFHRQKLEDLKSLKSIFKKYNPTHVIHLGAQAGVRYSLKNPKSYIDSNILGTFNILESAKIFKLSHLLIASTSSVYGANKRQPFKETDKVDTPLSLYAASKKSCEILAHSYSYNWQIPITIFRFFTVYGPWGRPDMAFFKFIDLAEQNKNIEVYNYGKMERDFTYIDDLTISIEKLLNKIPTKRLTNDSLSSVAPYRIVNIGNASKQSLEKAIKILEKNYGKVFKKEYVEMQRGDVKSTLSSSNLLSKLIKFSPDTSIEKGIKKFVKWYKEYNSI
tara:strand:+ start:1437 stop:2444 length:1008 start_codon:yes stop_codon:yes gene_type:complete